MGGIEILNDAGRGAPPTKTRFGYLSVSRSSTRDGSRMTLLNCFESAQVRIQHKCALDRVLSIGGTLR